MMNDIKIYLKYQSFTPTCIIVMNSAGTYDKYVIFPKNDLFVVFMMQSPRQRVPYRSILRNMVYAAIEK